MSEANRMTHPYIEPRSTLGDPYDPSVGLNKALKAGVIEAVHSDMESNVFIGRIGDKFLSGFQAEDVDGKASVRFSGRYFSSQEDARRDAVLMTPDGSEDDNRRIGSLRPNADGYLNGAVTREIKSEFSKYRGSVSAYVLMKNKTRSEAAIELLASRSIRGDDPRVSALVEPDTGEAVKSPSEIAKEIMPGLGRLQVRSKLHLSSISRNENGPETTKDDYGFKLLDLERAARKMDGGEKFLGGIMKAAEAAQKKTFARTKSREEVMGEMMGYR